MPLDRYEEGRITGRNVDVDEIIIFSMGIIALPAYRKYWSTNIFYKNEHFPSVLSTEQFRTILCFFNFVGNLTFRRQA